MRARLLSAPEECRRKVHPAQVKSSTFVALHALHWMELMQTPL